MADRDDTKPADLESLSLRDRLALGARFEAIETRLARLESQREAKAAGDDPAWTRVGVLLMQYRWDDARAMASRLLDAAQSATPPPAERYSPGSPGNPYHAGAANLTPPPADEVSDATLRMFAATIAPDNESLRVTARAALAARADLATARRERDEAREQLGEWMCAFDALAQKHAHPALVDAAKAGAKERAALSPTTEEPKP